MVLDHSGTFCFMRPDWVRKHNATHKLKHTHTHTYTLAHLFSFHAVMHHLCKENVFSWHPLCGSRPHHRPPSWQQLQSQRVRYDILATCVCYAIVCVCACGCVVCGCVCMCVRAHIHFAAERKRQQVAVKGAPHSKTSVVYLLLRHKGDAHRHH